MTEVSYSKGEGAGKGLKAGDLISGRYRLVSELGRGTMGVVYRAVHEEMNRHVALKTLLPHAANHERLVGRFKREVQIISQLRHPNTVTIFDHGQLDNGTLFFAMELLEGISLGSEIRRHGPLAPERVRNICIQILKSLSEAHGKGIIHRDLKPDNIFLEEIGGEKDFVKVLDFSIAKALAPVGGEGAELTSAGMTVGTPVYMAPEQFNEGVVSAPTDLYALGHMMFEMLGGRPIFLGSSWIEIALHKTEDKPVKLRDDIICGELGGIIVRAIKGRAEERYQSAEEMMADIAAVGDLSALPPYPHGREIQSMKADTHQLVVQTPFGPRAVTNANQFLPGMAPAPAAPVDPDEGVEALDEIPEIDADFLDDLDEDLEDDLDTHGDELPSAPTRRASSVDLLAEGVSGEEGDLPDESTAISMVPEFGASLDPMMAAEVTRIEAGHRAPPSRHDLKFRGRYASTLPPEVVAGMDADTRNLLVVGVVALGFFLLLLAVALAALMLIFGSP